MVQPCLAAEIETGSGILLPVTGGSNSEISRCRWTAIVRENRRPPASSLTGETRYIYCDPGMTPCMHDWPSHDMSQPEDFVSPPCRRQPDGFSMLREDSSRPAHPKRIAVCN
jgi:hypothetical protein